MDEVVVCTKGRVGLDDLFSWGTLFLFGFYYVKNCSVHDRFRDLNF